MPSPPEHFPALRAGFRYLDNAAGAQLPQQSIDAISRFLTAGSCNVGQPYAASLAAVDAKARARAASAELFNCKPGEVALGPSATALTFMLGCGARAGRRGAWSPRTCRRC